MTLAVSVHGLFATEGQGPEVLFTEDISPKVAVKVHSGEPEGHHYPAPVLIKGLVQSVGGTIVECNTAYPDKRFKTISDRRKRD